MRHGSLFSGIGGFDLAAEWMGWENVFHCEINEFCQKVLNHYWPNATSYHDIKKTDFTEWKGKIDVISGGFPCQPYSVAGKRKGKEDDRHLWPEMLRAVREVQPRWVIGENVHGLVNWQRGMVLDEIKTDLATSGFEVFPPFVLPACGVGGDHKRYRVWIVAYAYDKGTKTGLRAVQEKNGEISKWYNDAQSYNSNQFANTDHRQERNKGFIKEKIPQLEGLQRGEDGRIYAIFRGRPDLSPPVLCGTYNGIPNGMDRTASCGNAIVPQVVFEIFKTIEQYERYTNRYK